MKSEKYIIVFALKDQSLKEPTCIFHFSYMPNRRQLQKNMRLQSEEENSLIPSKPEQATTCPYFSEVTNTF